MKIAFLLLIFLNVSFILCWGSHVTDQNVILHRQKRQIYSQLFNPAKKYDTRLPYLNANYQSPELTYLPWSLGSSPSEQYRYPMIPRVQAPLPRTTIPPMFLVQREGINSRTRGPGWPPTTYQRPLPSIYSHQTANNPVNLGEPGIKPLMERYPQNYFPPPQRQFQPLRHQRPRVTYFGSQFPNAHLAVDSRFDPAAEAHIQKYNVNQWNYNAQKRDYSGNGLN